MLDEGFSQNQLDIYKQNIQLLKHKASISIISNIRWNAPLNIVESQFFRSPRKKTEIVSKIGD